MLDLELQCEDVQGAERMLKEMNIKYVKRIVQKAGIYTDQLFIHVPDGYMVEICNCEKPPMDPITTIESWGKDICCACNASRTRDFSQLLMYYSFQGGTRFPSDSELFSE